MTEVFFAVAIFVLAVAGLGLGLVLGRPPLRTTCERSDALPHARCADCPLRRRHAEETP